MLAYTSHLPLARQCLSVLVMQHAVLISDKMGQGNEGWGKERLFLCRMFTFFIVFLLFDLLLHILVFNTVLPFKKNALHVNCTSTRAF